ncbi:TonB-dependent receptor plug domain-containing protein [Aurantiacibacter gilvus]|uniref:TonB-dependent receptor n=1 Tax=Aurantiacibacter gilvus TaxID=3139141 RepID=A0ABU9IG55_9SPHN
MKKLLLASAASLLIATPVLAQDDDQDDSTASEDNVIVVLGEGLPETPGTPAYSTITIDRDQIISSGSGQLEDVLENVAGFQQFRRSDSRSANPSAQGATLRALGGNASSRALVLLDGVPMGDPFFGYIPYSAVDPSRLGQIRVTRGGGSGPFGGGALAGTIELESVTSADLQTFNAYGLINDRGDTELAASAAPQWDGGYAVVHGRWDRGDGFFTTPEADRVAATSRANYDSWSAGGRLVQQLGEDVEVQARVLAFEDNRTLRFDGADNSIEGQDVSLRLVTRGPWEVDALAYGQWRNFTNVVISSTRFVRVLDQKDTPAEGLGGKLEIRPPVGEDHTLRFGADYRRSEGDLFEDAYSAFSGNLTENRFAGGVNTDFGLFAEHDWEIGALTLTGGIRADRYTIRDGYYQAFDGSGAVVRDDTYPDRSDWEVSWRAGALFDVNDAVTLRAAAYTGFRLPTLNELYRPFVVFPVVTEANEALEPETLRGWEVGADFDFDVFDLSLTYFDNKVEDAIANVTIGTNLRQRRNLDAIEAQGVEVIMGFDMGDFRLDGSLVAVDAEVVGTGFAAPLDGNRPSQTPDLAASLTASWNFMDGGRLAATLRHVSDQFEGDQENDVLPAATTVDLFAQVPLVSNLSVIGRVENLFDEVIITRNQGGSMDIGTPLTGWIGLRWGY